MNSEMCESADAHIRKYVEWRASYPSCFFENMTGVYAKLVMSLNERDRFLNMISTWKPSDYYTMEKLHYKLNRAMNDIIYFSTFLAEKYVHTSKYKAAISKLKLNT